MQSSMSPMFQTPGTWRACARRPRRQKTREAPATRPSSVFYVKPQPARRRPRAGAGWKGSPHGPKLASLALRARAFCSALSRQAQRRSRSGLGVRRCPGHFIHFRAGERLSAKTGISARTGSPTTSRSIRSPRVWSSVSRRRSRTRLPPAPPGPARRSSRGRPISACAGSSARVQSSTCSVSSRTRASRFTKRGV